jgi:hypothetical protein
MRGIRQALMFVAFAACAACASGGTGTDNSDLSGMNPTDGAAADVVAADTSSQPMPESGNGGHDAGASDDSSGSMADGPSTSDSSSEDSAAPFDSSVGDTGGGLDSGVPDSALLDSGFDSSDAGCSTGPNASYLGTCTSCSISVTCLLRCASCTKKDQTQNLNPVVQLPCPGTTSVENNDGNLLCN